MFGRGDRENREKVESSHEPHEIQPYMTMQPIRDLPNLFNQSIQPFSAHLPIFPIYTAIPLTPALPILPLYTAAPPLTHSPDSPDLHGQSHPVSHSPVALGAYASRGLQSQSGSDGQAGK